MTNVCHALLYTPSGEHFGIVPLEAMHCRLPVVAVNDAGPKESVADGITGFLCQVNFEISYIFKYALKDNTFSGGKDILQMVSN